MRNLKGQFVKGYPSLKGMLGKKHSIITKLKMSKSQTGKKRPLRTEEWKIKQSISRKGQRNSIKTEFKKGFIPWNKGGHHSQISNEKNRLSHLGKFSSLKGKPNFSIKGEKNPNWNGGISSENQKIRGSIEYKLWEDSVLSRDNYKCQKCGDVRISKLVAHHILNFATYIDLRFAIDNGITFCRECHKEFHNKYGRKNNTKEQLKEFLT